MIVSQPSVTRLVAVLAEVARQLADGAAIGHVARLAARCDDTDYAAAAVELEPLIGAVARLATGTLDGAPPPAIDLDLGELASGLWAFAAYLRAPTREREAELDQLAATLAAAVAPPPTPRQLDGRIDELAREAAGRRGLTGDALTAAAARMATQIRALVRRLERQAQHAAPHSDAVELELRVALDQILGGRPQASA